MLSKTPVTSSNSVVVNFFTFLFKVKLFLDELESMLQRSIFASAKVASRQNIVSFYGKAKTCGYS